VVIRDLDNGNKKYTQGTITKELFWNIEKEKDAIGLTKIINK